VLDLAFRSGGALLAKLDRFEELCERMHARFSAAYPDSVRPKVHALLHLPQVFRNLGINVNAFTGEKKHLAARAWGAELSGRAFSQAAAGPGSSVGVSGEAVRTGKSRMSARSSDVGTDPARRLCPKGPDVALPERARAALGDPDGAGKPRPPARAAVPLGCRGLGRSYSRSCGGCPGRGRSLPRRHAASRRYGAGASARPCLRPVAAAVPELLARAGARAETVLFHPRGTVGRGAGRHARARGPRALLPLRRGPRAQLHAHEEPCRAPCRVDAKQAPKSERSRQPSRLRCLRPSCCCMPRTGLGGSTCCATFENRAPRGCASDLRRRIGACGKCPKSAVDVGAVHSPSRHRSRPEFRETSGPPHAKAQGT
jgi:hypothetical protein